jgi:tetratricopeptide (TPR) repeat protein
MPATSSPADGRPDGAAPRHGATRDVLRAPLRILSADPSAVPALGALALLIAWAANQAGYPQTHWAPGGLILLALLAIALGATGLRVASIPTPVRIAIAALAAYTAFSFLSILWANVPGDAWEGADRTLVYLIVFALFASFRRPSSSAALLLGLWALAMSGLAVYAVLHVNAAAGSAGALQILMPGGRLTFPSGYTNANAAIWMIAFFPAWLLAASRPLPPLARGLLAGGATVLAAAALYSQSRGSVYSIPVVLAFVFLLLPGRVRSFATLVPIGIGVGACVPAILRLDKRAETGVAASALAHSATLSVLVAGLIVAVLVAVAASVEGRWPSSQRVRGRVHRGIAVLGVLAVLILVVGGAAAVGKPVGRVEHAWNTFTSIRGYEANSRDESRLTGGFGSNRYDFYRVAWHEFLAHPLLGIGADNFEQQYLRLGRSLETPHYPHSVELRALAETGLIGTIVALAGLVGSLLAVRRALKRSDPLVRAVAAGAVSGFAYWVVHGSFDWFFEYAGLGAAAFMLLGLACSLSPARSVAIEGEQFVGSPAVRSRRITRLVGAVGIAALVALAFAAPWLSRMEVQSAARVWNASPRTAYARLEQAARLNPLSAEPNLIAGTIALRRNELSRARRQFQLALDRVPGDAYATLELGAIASSRGEATAALRLLRRAAALNPRSALTEQALATARRKERVNIVDLNRSILREATQFS